MAKILSAEDGNLQGASLTTSRSRLYSDFDLSFAVNTSSGDIFKKKDAAAVKQAVKNLLQTNRMEKPFRPDFGADLRGMLFELADDGTEQDLIEQVQGSISRYEPRAKITDLELNVSLDTNTLKVRIEFEVLNTDENVTLETTVSRLR
jgi:phage baseplate assembly protein W